MKSIKEIRRGKLAIAITEKCEGNQSRASEALGYSTASLVNRYLSGAKDIGDKTARKIESVFGYPQYWMDQNGTESGASSNTAEAQPAAGVANQDADDELKAFAGSDFQRMPKGRQVPVVGQAQGGPDGYISIHDYPPDQGDGWIIMPTRDPSAYGLRVRGDSMRPRIKSGEFILVEPSFEAQPGDDVVVKFRDGSAVAKELLWVRDDEVCLGSINNGVPPMTRPLESVQTIHRIAAIIPRGSPLHVPSA